jgi:hypothetical protein
MSAGSWIRRQRDRPIAEHERRTAMAVIVVLLATATVLLTLTQPASQASRPASPNHSARTSPGAVLQRDGRETGRVAEGFLAGYLSYTYGRSPASRIADASQSLIVSLQAHPPQVSPAVRVRHPRIVSLQPATAPGGELAVTATVNDGGLIDYRVRLLLTREHRRLLVTGLGGA